MQFSGAKKTKALQRHSTVQMVPTVLNKRRNKEHRQWDSRGVPNGGDSFLWEEPAGPELPMNSLGLTLMTGRSSVHAVP